VVHGASCVTGIDLHITLVLLAHKSPSSLDRAGGARGGRREGSASGEENFTIAARIGAHY
jgi:hypothetical protein